MKKNTTIDLNMFLNLAKINRVYVLDVCDYEVTEPAMRYYLKYSSYSDWEMIQDNRKQGAFLLKYSKLNDVKYLTADILTSIKTPIEKIVAKKLDCDGEYIVNAILNSPFLELRDGKGRGRKPKLKIDEKLQLAVKAFAMVCYWVGNTMPTGSNFSPGNNSAWSNDTWKVKLDEIFSIFNVNEEEWEKMKQSKIISTIPRRNEKQKKRWPAWITACWGKNELDKFVSDNYLQDLVKKEDKKTEVKEIVSEDITDENEKIKKRFLTNTKIIIQRSYRIIFDFKGDWNASKEDKENVICIIEYVYQNAGMDEQTIKEIELF